MSRVNLRFVIHVYNIRDSNGVINFDADCTIHTIDKKFEKVPMSATIDEFSEFIGTDFIVENLYGTT